jgi:hypothetical protein
VLIAVWSLVSGLAGATRRAVLPAVVRGCSVVATS